MFLTLQAKVLLCFLIIIRWHYTTLWGTLGALFGFRMVDSLLYQKRLCNNTCCGIHYVSFVPLYKTDVTGPWAPSAEFSKFALNSLDHHRNATIHMCNLSLKHQPLVTRWQSNCTRLCYKHAFHIKRILYKINKNLSVRPHKMHNALPPDKGIPPW